MLRLHFCVAWARAACVGLVTVAGLSCSSVHAQSDDPLDLPLREAWGPGTQEGVRSRVVYCTCFPTNGGDFRGLGTAARLAGDDFTIDPGPGARPPYALDGSLFAVVQTTGGVVNDVSVRICIYDNFLGWQIGGFPGSSLLDCVTYDLQNFLEPGSITYYPSTIPFPNSATILLPDTSGFVTVEMLAYQGEDYHPTAYTVGRGTSASIVSPGSSDPERWSDNNRDRRITGPAPSAELFNPVGASFRALYFGLSAIVPCDPEPASTDLGTLAISTTAVTGSTSGIAPRWYHVTLATAAADGLRQFLDVDTEGSTADAAIAIYGTEGTVCGRLAGRAGNDLSAETGSDDDSGSGANAQLTFGVGRRESIGNGREYDGRDGELPAGSYLIAVAPGGTIFRDNYRVTIPANAGVGAFTLRVRTNTNGQALGPSRRPAEIVQDLGCLVNQPLIVGATFNVEPYEIGWYKFAVPEILAGGTRYLDIDFSRTQIPADAVAYVFDCDGSIVARGDFAPPGCTALPYFSWGNMTISHGPPCVSGYSGGLEAGEYWLGVGLFPTTPLAAQDRFHLRSGEGSSLDINPDFYSNLAGTCGLCAPACDTLDFNSDSVTPDLLDLTDFINTLSNAGPCSNAPHCNGVDFNNDGMVNFSTDLDAFLRAFAGGGC